MTKKYVPIRFPKIAYENLIAKQKKMEDVAKEILGKPVSIPLTKILVSITKSPLILSDKAVIALVKKKKRRLFSL